MSFTVKEKKLKNFNSSEKKYKDNAKENNFNRVPLVEKTNNSNNNNLSFSSLNVSGILFFLRNYVFIVKNRKITQ